MVATSLRGIARSEATSINIKICKINNLIFISNTHSATLRGIPRREIITIYSSLFVCYCLLLLVLAIFRLLLILFIIIASLISLTLLLIEAISLRAAFICLIVLSKSCLIRPNLRRSS